MLYRVGDPVKKSSLNRKPILLSYNCGAPSA